MSYHESGLHTGHPDADTPLVPMRVQPMWRMHMRVEKAMAGTFDPSSPEFVPPDKLGRKELRPHLFDFMDRMRMTISTHYAADVGRVIHVMADWSAGDRRPATRAEGMQTLKKRARQVLAGLGDDTEPEDWPEPLRETWSENGRPHLFYPYPSVTHAPPDAE